MWGQGGLCCLLPEWLQSELDDGDHGHVDGGDDDDQGHVDGGGDDVDVDDDHVDDCYLNGCKVS